METLEQILWDHAKKYPLMQPVDAVKLIYQNVYGGGHLIRDPEACLRMMGQEYAATPQEPGAPLLEWIGNGMARVMLNALAASGYSIEQLGWDFIRSAREPMGDRQEFLRKLEILRKVTAAGAFSFGSGDLEVYLAEYRQAGYPMVSHSDRYRQAYKPAYRVVALRLLPETLTRTAMGRKLLITDDLPVFPEKEEMALPV